MFQSLGVELNVLNLLLLQNSVVVKIFLYFKSFISYSPFPNFIAEAAEQKTDDKYLSIGG